MVLDEAPRPFQLVDPVFFLVCAVATRPAGDSGEAAPDSEIARAGARNLPSASVGDFCIVLVAGTRLTADHSRSSQALTAHANPRDIIRPYPKPTYC